MSALDGPRLHLRVTDSTNDRARALALAGAPSGTVVTAGRQTEGRGRHGRSWSAPADSALLCSVLLRPLARHQSLLPLAVPLAVCEAAESLAPVRCAVKWPNDVWLGERKLAGVLLEARPPDWAVIGIGLNLSVEDSDFPPDLRWPATSLGHGAGADDALAALREALGRWVTARPEEVVAAFGERDALRGRGVSWEATAGLGTKGSERHPGPGDRMSGTAAGVDGRGNLLVRLPSGERVALGSGEVQLSLD